VLYNSGLEKITRKVILIFLWYTADVPSAKAVEGHLYIPHIHEEGNYKLHLPRKIF
jgi:hypothetical protein